MMMSVVWVEPSNVEVMVVTLVDTGVLVDSVEVSSVVDVDEGVDVEEGSVVDSGSEDVVDVVVEEGTVVVDVVDGACEVVELDGGEAGGGGGFNVVEVSGSAGGGGVFPGGGLTVGSPGTEVDMMEVRERGDVDGCAGVGRTGVEGTR